MKHEVHEGEAVSVLDVFHAVKGIMPVFPLLGLRPHLGSVLFFDIPVGSDQKAAGACCGVLDDVIEGGFHHCNHGVDEGAGSKILPCARFLFIGIFLKQPFIKVA